MATKPKNISPKKTPKFKENPPKSVKNKTFLKGEKIEKIKLAFKKSKIKDKKAIITLNKKAYNNKQTMDFVNSSFSELIKSKDKVSIQKFFDIYRDLFYDIPKKGEKSHESLIVQSQEYINNYIDWRDAKIEQLLDELELKENELTQKQNPTTAEHIFYTNGTFLRTHGLDTEYVENVPQGLPIWVMQEGMRREFKSYDAYKIAKRAAGFTNMWYDTDKKELMGDKDIDILEVVHTTDLNYLPTGRDITESADLNLPSGPDRKIDISLANILDYYKADLTCLEGVETDNPNEVQPENYSANHDLKDTRYVRYWVLDGTRYTSRRWEPGETIQVYFRKDNPDFGDSWLSTLLSGDEDGIFDMEGYIRFDYDHPENTPTKYVNIPFDTSFSADTLPAYIEPTYSNYGTRMYDPLGYGDQRKHNGDYQSGLYPTLWEQVLSDPSNAFYNGDYDWSNAKNCDRCEEIGPNIRKGGGYKGENNYSRIYMIWGRFYQYLGKWNRSGVYRDRYYYVILDKDYNGDSHPLSDSRVKYVYTQYHNEVIEKAYKHNYGGALSFSEANKFPQDQNGYYIPQENWDEFGFIP